MASIDQRVVQMKFDNAEFQKGVQSTTKSINDLNSSLNGAQGGKNYLSGLSSNVQNASSSFNGLQVAAITALGTIVSKATTAGLSLVKSLSLDPIMGGFRDYETKMDSVKVISANSGESMQVINAALADMNQYATKTIYSFADMTKNMGLFTNAGLGVTESASMLKGFSNEAARSGTNATQAAGAAYQLSQALSTGTIRLMDWRSLTNANMGSSKMREGLVQIAEAMGTIESAGTTSEAVLKDFNGSLEKGWLSSDVMSNYLQIMAGDMDATKMAALGLSEAQIKAFQDSAKEAQGAAQNMSTFSQMWETVVESVKTGWMALSEDLFGGLDEATKLWTGIGNAITGVIDGIFGSMHKVLVQWDELGGKAELFNSIAGFLKGIGKILGTVGSAFTKAFSGSGGKGLKTVTSAISKLFQILTPSETIIKGFSKAFNGLGTVVKALGKPLGAAGSAIMRMVSPVSDFVSTIGGKAVDAIANFINKIAEFGKYFAKTAKESGFLTIAMEAVSDAVEKVASIFSSVKSKISDFFGTFTSFKGIKMEGLFDGLKSGVDRAMDTIKNGNLSFGESLKTIFSEIGSSISGWFGTIIDALKAAFDKVKSYISAGMDGVSEAIGISKDAISNAFSEIVDWAKKAGDAIKNFFGGFGKTASSATSKASSAVTESGKKITEGFKALTGSATKGGEELERGFAATFERLSGQSLGIDFSQINQALTTGLLGVIAYFVKKLGDSVGDIQGFINTFSGIGKSISGVFDSLGNTLGAFEKKIKAAALKEIATAILLLSAALFVLSRLSWEELGVGITGLAAVLASISAQMFAFTKMVDQLGNLETAKIVGTILGISLAMIALAAAVKIFSTMDLEELATGILSLAASLGMVTASLMVIPKDLDISGIVKLSIALLLLVVPVKLLGSMDLPTLIQGMISMGLALGALALALQTIPADIKLGGLIGLSVTLLSLSVGLKILADIPLLNLAAAIVALVTSLSYLAVTGILFASYPQMGPVLMALGAGVLVLAAGLKVMAGIGIQGIAVALLALVASLTVLGVAAAILAPISPIILALAASFALFGAGVMAIGTGLLTAAVAVTMFMAALQALALLSTVSSAAIMASITMLVEGFILAMSLLIQGLIGLAPQIGELALTMLTTFLTVLVEATPQIVQAGCDMIIALLDGLARNIGEIVTKATDLIVNFINGITQNLPRIIDAGFNLVVSLVTGIAKKIGEMASKGGEIVGKLVSGIGSKIHQLWDKGKEMAQNVIDGLKNALSSSIEQVKNKILDIAKGAWDAFKGFFGINSPSKLMMSGGQYIIAGLVKGLRKDGHLASEAIADEGKNMESSMKDTVKTLSDIMALDMDTTIKPTMDLTNIEKASGDISKLLDGYSVQLGANTLASEKLKTGYSLKAAEAAKPNNISFTQNNYSPKALSTVEIYRQTNSQINRVKSMIGI